MKSLATVERDGCRLGCRIAGNPEAADAALLIHGLNTNMAFWHPLLVRRLGEKRRVLLYDQRGHGGSDMPAAGYTCADLARDAVAVLDAQGVASADIIAHSFGAGVALQLACTEPSRVRSVVILDGRLHSFQPDVRLRDWLHFARWVKPFEEAGVTIDPDWKLDCTLPLRLADSEIARVAGTLQAEGFFVPQVAKRAAEKYRRLMTETSALEELQQSPPDLTADNLQNIAVPVLLLYGAESPFKPTCDELALMIENARVELFPGAGHNFPLTQPERTLDALDRFGLLSAASDISDTKQDSWEPSNGAV